ncbi:MAG: hypothetical protein IT287_09970 [Bdellovibrionaceae bacterium]|nr:hypothetical protein [Pseudobdellovibrionaceae bacterium]
MKIIFSIASLLISIQTYANTKEFDIKAEISIDGKIVSKPQIITKPNETASISQDNGGKNAKTIIEVIASDDVSGKVKDGIMMKFTVSYINGKKRTVVSKPQIIAKSGETAEIAVGDKGQPDALMMKVIATRVQ